MDRLEYIQELQEKSYQHTKKQSIIINNFFSLITIVIISITIILYVSYVVPAQKSKKDREIKRIEQEKFFDKRAKERELSHKLNQKREYNK